MVVESFLVWLEHKFHNGSSMKCGHCGGMILCWSIEINEKHIYPIGMRFTCLDCRRCNIWTNSIRNAKNFLEFLTTGKAYTNGFCNDQFCGLCHEILYPLENGYEFEGKSYDRYGCLKCQDNQMVLVDGSMKAPEGNHTWIIAWYRRNKDLLEKIVKEGYW